MFYSFHFFSKHFVSVGRILDIIQPPQVKFHLTEAAGKQLILLKGWFVTLLNFAKFSFFSSKLILKIFCLQYTKSAPNLH